VAVAAIITGTRLTNTTARASVARRPIQSIATLTTHVAIAEVTRSGAAVVLFLVILCSFLLGLGFIRLPELIVYDDHNRGRCSTKRPRKRSRKRQNLEKTRKKLEKEKRPRRNGESLFSVFPSLCGAGSRRVRAWGVGAS
jgi:hypothetical protein